MNCIFEVCFAVVGKFCNFLNILIWLGEWIDSLQVIAVALLQDLEIEPKRDSYTAKKKLHILSHHQFEFHQILVRFGNTNIVKHRFSQSKNTYKIYIYKDDVLRRSLEMRFIQF